MKKTTRLLSIILTVAILVGSLSPVTSILTSATDSGVTYVYSEMEDCLHPHIKDYYETFHMYDAVGLELRGGAVVTDLDWRWQLNSVDTAVVFSPAYAIFHTENKTPFSATFTKTTDISKLTCFVSYDMVTWYKKNFAISDKTITIPRAISFVKLVWSSDNNTNMGLSSVTYTEGASDANVFCYNYGTDASAAGTAGSGSTDASILINRGIWESNGVTTYNNNPNRVIRPTGSTLTSATTSNSFNGYATYKVQPGTRFGLTVTSSKGAAITTAATRLGYSSELDWNMQIYGSSDNVNFEMLRVDPVYSAGYANYQPLTGSGKDARRRADWNFIVPDDVVYIKCKFPITQNLSTQEGIDGNKVYSWSGNDIFDINRVEFTSLKYDYCQATEGDYYIEGNLNNDTKSNFGIYSYGGGFFRTTKEALKKRLDSNYSWQSANGHAGTNVVYRVKPGTPFYAEFYVNYESNLTKYLNSENFGYFMTILGSNDRSSWTEITTVINNSNFVSGKKYYTVSIGAEENTYEYIRILWPAKLSSNVVGNEIVLLDGVAFTEYVPNFKAHSLVLSEKIGINFYMDLASLSEAEKTRSYMTFEIENNEVGACLYDSEYVNGIGYYRFTYYVGSLQAANDITPTYHYGDGKTIVGNDYSVLDYINFVITNSSGFSAENLDYTEQLNDYFITLLAKDLNADETIDILDLVRAEYNSEDDSSTYNTAYLLNLSQAILGVDKYIGNEIEENGDIYLSETP